MSPITITLAVLVAAEFCFIFHLETIATTSARTAKVFGMTQEELSRDSVSILFKNQGMAIIYLALQFRSGGTAGSRLGVFFPAYPLKIVIPLE